MMGTVFGKRFRFKEAGGLFCGHCLSFNSTLRTDRKGRPFLWCDRCRTRSFIGSEEGLSAIRVMSAAVLKRVQDMAAAVANDDEHRSYAERAGAAIEAAAVAATGG